MTRGLYTAYTGMYNEQKRLDIISNNLANSATIGYKEEEMLTYKIRDRSNGFVDEPIGKMSLGVKIGETYTNWDQGSRRQTENTYDIAIQGSGFFTVRATNAKGEDKTYYTRNGCFTATRDGFIVDSDGNHLQGEGGDLQVPTDAAKIVIDRDGAVYADNLGDSGRCNGDQGNLFSGTGLYGAVQCQCDRPDGGHDHDHPGI